MTKFVEAVAHNKNITKGKIYEVIYETKNYYLIEDDINYMVGYSKNLFKEVEAQKEETNFKFIPEAEIQYATVNGVKGILIKEE